MGIGQPAVDYRKLFAEIHTVAVVGYSDKPERAGHFVAHYLKKQGYEVIAINPRFGAEINGLACYPSLSAVPAGTQVDVVDVFRAPDAVPQVAAEVLALAHKPRFFWMQPGAESEEAAQQVSAAGIVPILGACMLAEHKKLDSRR